MKTWRPQPETDWRSFLPDIFHRCFTEVLRLNVAAPDFLLELAAECRERGLDELEQHALDQAASRYTSIRCSDILFL